MSGSRIRVEVETMPGRWIEIAMTLDDYLVREAWAPLDTPSPGADPFTAALCCTAPERVEYVKTLRANAARMISDALTAKIMEAMGGGDTQMGYKT